LRLQAHPTRRRAPRAAVVVASIPVLVQVYAAEAGRRVSSARPSVLVAALLIATVAVGQLGGGSATAGPSPAYRPLPVDKFQQVVLPNAAHLLGDSSQEAARRTLAPNPEAEAPSRVVGRVRGEVPRVVRFRPHSGQTGISRFAAVSVRFTRPMDHRATETAFRATAGGKDIRGRYVWAERDTVLVLIPNRPFAYSAWVTLRVSKAAESVDGMGLDRPRTTAFRVIAKPVRTATAAPAASTKRSSAWRWPLIGPITQYFGQHLTEYGFHQGIDINGDTGDPVVAAHAGRVVVAGYWDSCGGLQVHIDHGNGFESWYRHLSAINVRAGQRVSAGTFVGRVGATGCAFGSHLHFGVRRGSTFVDPLRYLPRRQS
jgi:murein DD-endopeptidase MepM/ murein hydrolase activator NlpD